MWGDTSDVYEKMKMRLIDQRPLNGPQLERLVGMQPNTLIPSMHDYVERLRHLSMEYMVDTEYYGQIGRILHQLENHIPPPYIPQRLSTVLTTDKNGWSGVPPKFHRWKKLLPDYWNVEVIDDDGMESRMWEYTKGVEKLRDIWEVIPKPVMKSDILRYFFLLLEGGIYTDSDTAPLANPSHWGSGAKASQRPYELQYLDSFIKSQLRYPGQGAPLTPPDSSRRPPISGMGQWGGIDSDDTSMVISVEWDAIDEGVVDPEHTEERYEGWGNGGCPRSMQIVQWTMMAKSFHPIYLDAVLTSFDNIEKARQEGHLDGSISILELTGPAVFTDAVYRYLYAKYGVVATDISGMKNSMMIGDILLLRKGAFFPTDASLWFSNWFTFDTFAQQQTPVKHYFRGSWRTGDRGWEGLGPEEDEE